MSSHAEASYECTNDASGGRVLLRAARDIKTGEEILITYHGTAIFQKRKERWKWLEFECKCTECCLDGLHFEVPEKEMPDFGNFYRQIYEMRSTYYRAAEKLWEYKKKENRKINEDRLATHLTSFADMYINGPPFMHSGLYILTDTMAAIFTARAMHTGDVSQLSRAVDMKRKEVQILSTCIGPETSLTLERKQHLANLEKSVEGNQAK